MCVFLCGYILVFDSSVETLPGSGDSPAAPLITAGIAALAAALQRDHNFKARVCDPLDTPGRIKYAKNIRSKVFSLLRNCLMRAT